jgi:ElaB/YqjD/DUF883 family membrane-anchored ribosome-binding protein
MYAGGPDNAVALRISVATFKVLSDLIADAEDLLAKLGDSTTPEINALRSKVQESIAEIKRQARLGIKNRTSASADFKEKP